MKESPKPKPEEGEIVKCKLFGICRPDVCPGYIILDDWEGCALELSEMAVKESLRDGARALDQFMDNITKLLGPRR